MKHISETEADKYLQNKVGALKKFNIERHLKNCPACTGLLEKARKDMRFLEKVKEAVKEQQSTASGQQEKDTLLKLQQKFNSHI